MKLAKKKQFCLCSPLKPADFGYWNVQNQQRFSAAHYAWYFQVEKGTNL